MSDSRMHSLAVAGLVCAAAGISAQGHRPPAVPLVVHDPYFSVWSTSNELHGSATRHWTGTEHSLTSMIRIDGKVFRLMGKDPAGVPPLPQTGLSVLPTRTIYSFAGEGVRVNLTFTTPTLPHDIDMLSRPATYLTWEVAATDGKAHEASIYLDASAQLTVNRPEQEVQWARERISGLTVLKMGSKAQPVLGKRGDDLRIDWGHLYLSAEKASGSSIGARESVAASFAAGRKLPGDDRHMPRAVQDSQPVLALTLDLGKVSAVPVSRYAVLAYDDEYSIVYFREKLRPYWRRNGLKATDLLKAAHRDYALLKEECRAFDERLLSDLKKMGGDDYAYIGSLAFRQCFGAHKVAADANGQPLMFSKENYSNGCIATVDVLYPASPALFLFSPSLMKASLVPVLDYAMSPRWKFPFAPHDLGTYPWANGQVYGGGERTEDNQMPVEESGNMLILLAALAKLEGDAKFSEPYWPVISKWAQYLADKGFDPESQLSTDDFAGHLAHNVNLSAKAIEALGAYAYLCELRGLSGEARRFRTLAEQFASRWVKEAQDGTHFRLAFDKPGTWSQKYNLVWDRLLGINLFPQSVLRKELDYYLSKQNKYGLPLDNRRDYTKLDWILWTATLTGERRDFDALVKPIVTFLNETPDRVPMTDWYGTVRANKEGFQARSVVGGVFIKMLEDPAMWRAYASRDKTKLGEWATLPLPPIVTTVVPASDSQAIEWRYTTTVPLNGWQLPGFSDASWKSGPGGFGTANTPGTNVRTTWDNSDIWIRREFELTTASSKDLKLWIHHDEDAEVYINGVLAASPRSYTTQYTTVDISPEALKALKVGKNVIAIHCRQTGGGQYIDAGLVTVKEQPRQPRRSSAPREEAAR